MCDVIDRPSLGTVARLGDLFDARNEKFLNVSIFQKTPPPTSISTTDNHTSDLSFISNENFANKVTSFNLTAGLTLNLLSGALGSVDGSGKYLQKESSKTKKVKSTLLYSVKTMVDNLEIYHDDLQQCISHQSLMSGVDQGLGFSATHVVVRIDWGAKIVVTAETVNEDQEVEQAWSGKLDLQLKRLFSGIKLNGNVGIDSKTPIDKHVEELFSVQVYADILPKSGCGHYSGWNEIKELVNNFPDLLKLSNMGKGKPISYGLIPITVLQAHLKLPLSTLNWRPIELEFVNSMVTIFDEIRKLKLELTDFLQNIKNFEYCLTDEDPEESEKLLADFTKTEFELKSELKMALLKLQNGVEACEVSLLFASLSKRYSTSQSPFFKSVSAFLKTQGGEVGLKISLAKTFRNLNIRYLKRGESIDMAISAGNSAERKYILFVGPGVRTVQPGVDPVFRENLNFYINLARSCQQSQHGIEHKAELIYGDGNIQETGISERVAVHYYRQGNLETSDLLKDSKEIPVTGVFDLVDNRNFEDILSAIGLGFLKRKAILLSNCRVTISENDGEYHILIKTSVGNVESTFRLNQEFEDMTYDGLSTKAIATREGNTIVVVQTLKNPGNQQKTRTMIRTFNKTGMLVHFKSNGATATRVFKRVPCG